LWLSGTGELSGTTFTSHLGNLPALVADAGETATKVVIAARLTLADVANRSIIIHASHDVLFAAASLRSAELGRGWPGVAGLFAVDRNPLSSRAASGCKLTYPHAEDAIVSAVQLFARGPQFLQ
jgi:hypothetical protein